MSSIFLSNYNVIKYIFQQHSRVPIATECSEETRARCSWNNSHRSYSCYPNYVFVLQNDNPCTGSTRLRNVQCNDDRPQMIKKSDPNSVLIHCRHCQGSYNRKYFHHHRRAVPAMQKPTRQASNQSPVTSWMRRRSQRSWLCWRGFNTQLLAICVAPMTRYVRLGVICGWKIQQNSTRLTRCEKASWLICALWQLLCRIHEPSWLYRTRYRCQQHVGADQLTSSSPIDHPSPHNATQ